MFVHLRGRGTYSMLEGIGAHNDIIQSAQSHGQSAIALTDLYGMYGVVDFYNKCKGSSLKSLIGVELPYTNIYSAIESKKNVIEELGTLTLLAKADAGYHTLLKIVSQSYVHNPDGLPCMDYAVLQSHHDDVMLLIGGIGSVLYHAVSHGQDDEYIYGYIDGLVSVTGKENILIDITAQSYDYYPILRDLHPILIQYAQDRGLTMVTSSGYLYPKVEQQGAYQTALAIKDNKKTYDPDARIVQGAHHVLSEEEVRTILLNNKIDTSLIDEMIENTGIVADQCTVKIKLGQMLFPNYDTPEEIQVLYEEHKDQLIQ